MLQSSRHFADERPFVATGFIVAAISLGHACQSNNGAYSEDALFWLVFALAAAFVPFVAPRNEIIDGLCRRALPIVLAAGVAAEAADLLTASPAIYIHSANAKTLQPFFMGAAFAVVVASTACTSKPILGRGHVFALIGIYLGLGVWVLRASPNPWIDVFVFQRECASALLHGENPYAITFPNIYGNSAFYGPGMVSNGRVLLGYLYLPLTLLMILPSFFFLGDSRFAQLAAIALVALAIGTGRSKSRYGLGAAALILLLPRGFFVLEQSWTEPFVLVTLAATVFCARYRPRLLPYSVGLFFASKQYSALLLIAALTFLDPKKPKESLAFVARAAMTGLLITLPFVLWSPHAFYHSAVEMQFHQPFRDDALSVLVWYKRAHGEVLPLWPSFVGALLVSIASLFRLPRSAAGFVGGVALTLLIFVSFNKQAFCNYYFLVSGALLLAAGA